MRQVAMPPAANASSPFPLRPHPHLYEINTWVWLEKLSARYGRRTTLANIPDAEWDALAQQGYDIIWLMGVWQRSALSRQHDLDHQGAQGVYDQVLPGWTPDDVIGSPYSVVQYVPDPRIGVWLDIDIAREKLNARNMALFLDFVGNHTALDSPWTRSHPEYYVQGTIEDFQKTPPGFFKADTVSATRYLAFGKDPYFPAWEDVAQLNHFQPQMRAAQLADLKTIASHCDGVRCDMAMLQLNEIFGRIWQPFVRDTKAPAQEFWTEARAAVPNLILLAEAYWGTEQRLIDLGFSFVYDKGFYDAVRDANIGDVRSRLSAPISYQSHLGRFLENHDEQCCAMAFGDERLPAIVTLMGTVPGLRFYLQGEPEGFATHQPIELRRIADQPPNPAIAKIFAKILKITNEDVFHNAEWNLLQINAEGDASPGGLIAYEWRSEKSWKLIVVNLSGNPSQGRIPFGENVSAEKQYMFYDELNDVHYARDGKELHAIGLFVRRDAFQAHLFDVTSA
jgi:hypothetical protein